MRRISPRLLQQPGGVHVLARARIDNDYFLHCGICFSLNFAAKIRKIFHVIKK